jgi:pimeloyl-ACP methyl ester carboxylesterase
VGLSLPPVSSAAPSYAPLHRLGELRDRSYEDQHGRASGLMLLTAAAEGPPLVLVHDTSADHTRWKPVLPTFEEHFTVYAVDRRGRGGSGDSEDYFIELEFGDVAAVVDSLGEPAYLLGHSYGALCALEATLLTCNVRKLVLYEPPVKALAEKTVSSGVVDRLEALLEAGDREGVVAPMLREVAEVPTEVVEHMRSLPAWQAREAAVHTIPRELRAHEAYRFDPKRFGDLRVATLLLKGGESPDTFEEGERAVREALPNFRTVVMPGQGHVAMDTGTVLFTMEVLRVSGKFLGGGQPQAPLVSETALFTGVRGETVWKIAQDLSSARPRRQEAADRCFFGLS